MSDNVKTKAEIIDSIKVLEEELEKRRSLEDELRKRRAELEAAEEKEYQEELHAFLDHFGLHTSDDIRRLRNALEGFVGLGNGGRPAETVPAGAGETVVSHETLRSPNAPVKEVKTKPVSAPEAEKEAGHAAAVEKEPADVPMKTEAEAPNAMPNEASNAAPNAAASSAEPAAETAPAEPAEVPAKEAPASSDMSFEMDWSELAESIDDDQLGEKAEEAKPEEGQGKGTEGTQAEEEKDPFSLDYNALFDQADEDDRKQDSQAAAGTEISEEEDPFKAIMDDTESGNFSSATQADEDAAVKAVMDFGYDIPVEHDSSEIDPAMVIANMAKDPTVAKYKSRPVVVDAENKLLEAITAAVHEGWVTRDQVLDKFFQGADLTGDIYNTAQGICDNLENVWKESGVSGGPSEEKLKEFTLFPFHVRSKAVVCCMADLKDYLGK